MTSQKLKLPPHGLDAPDLQQPQEVKRPKLTTSAIDAAAAAKLPFRKIVTWNCNGFTTRCRLEQQSDRQLQELVRQTQADIYCFQEVRLKAASPSNRGTPLEQEYRGAVERVLTSTSSTSTRGVFADYRPFWSLADSKYAGTLTLIRRRACQENGDLQAAFSFRAARNLLLNSFNLTAQDCGIVEIQEEPKPPPSKGSNGGDKKQRSVASFFTAKKPSSSSSSKQKLPTSRHDPEGRFQFFRFPRANLDLIQTYVPNNGDRPEKWQRRADWDNAVQTFLRDRQLIYQKAGVPLPRLLWCGDLNVARDYRDGTHWRRVVQSSSSGGDNAPDDDNDEKKASGNNNNDIYEWWTDESQCFVQRRGNGNSNSNSKNNSNSKHPDHVGIPGFTPAERRRFDAVLDEADLVDVWRALHPDGDNSNNSSISKLSPPLRSSEWDAPNWTWRGHLSKNGDKKAKYEGKGQRLDYFLLSPSNLVTTTVDDEPIVESCAILGYGSRREGLFCGSDHCAVALTFKDDKTTAANKKEEEE